MVEGETLLHNKMNITIEGIWPRVRHLADCKSITVLLRHAHAALRNPPSHLQAGI